MTRMYGCFNEIKWNGGCPGNRCPVASCMEAPCASSTLTMNKSSKQSALAVTSHLRDNQHQSPGRPRYALA